MSMKGLVTLMMALVLLPAIAMATTIHVPADQPTIQAGINAAVDGDTVLVAPGTYRGSGNCDLSFLGRAIVLKAETSGSSVTIDGQHAHRFCIFSSGENPTSVVDGFKIEYCSSSSGGAIYCEGSSPLITNCVFQSNSANDGGAVSLLGSGAEIRGNTFRLNSAWRGGAIAVRNSHIPPAEIQDNVIDSCIASHEGGGIYLGSTSGVAIRRNLFTRDSSHLGGAIRLASSNSIAVINNTFDLNNGDEGGCIDIDNSYYATVKNNIFSNTKSGLAVFFRVPATESYNCLFGNLPSDYYGRTPDTSDVPQDPLYLAVQPDYYLLQAESPCINAGDPSPEYTDSDGSRNDIGAYFFASGVPAPNNINFGTEAFGHYVFSLTPSIHWSYFDTLSTTQLGYEIEAGTDTSWTMAEMWSSGAVMSSDKSVIYDGLTLSDYAKYFLRIRVYNGIDWGAWRSSYFVTHAQRSIRVPTLKPTIQEGIDFSVNGDTVLVAPGTFAEHINFNGRRILLKSEQGPEVTTIAKLADGFDLVTFGLGCDTTSIIDGFTIENSNSSQCINIGQHSGATIRGNRIRNSSGLAILSYSRAIIANNAISTCAYGIKCIQSSYSQISGNMLSGCSSPLQLESCTNLNVSSNSLIGNSGGMTLNGANNSIVFNNSLTNNEGGMALYGASSKVIGNSMLNNAGGIVLSGENSEVTGNWMLNNGGGIVLGGANLNVTGNLLLNNTEGIALDVADNSIVRQNTLAMNTAVNGAISVAGSAGVRIENNTLVKNNSLAGIYVYEGSSASIVKQNIVALNTSWGIRVPVIGCCLSATYNDVFGNTTGNYYGVMPGAGSISVDPRFCDFANNDMNLAATSPCLGAGEGGVNIGALGIGCELPVAEQPQVANINIGEYEDSLHVTSHTPPFSWKYYDPQSRPLTKSELQVGTDSDWSVAEVWEPPVIQSSDTSITYAGLPLQDGSTYYVRVRVHNDTIWGNWKVAAFRLNSTPSIPTLNAPANGSVTTTGRPTLKVNNASDAEGDPLHYDFTVYADSNLTTLVTFVSGINQGSGQTAWKTDSLRNENARHWWRARATDGYASGEWSEPWSFAVNAYNEAPNAFALISPDSGLTTPLTTLLPQFTWVSAFDPDPSDSVRYALFIALDQHFSFANQIPDLTTTSHTLTDSLTWGTRYWWKVKAYDLHGGTNWSIQVFSLRTIAPGDADNDGEVTVADVVFLVNYVFVGGAAPDPFSAGDSDCDGSIDVADAVYLVNYIFSGGAEPCIPAYNALKTGVSQ
jgi:parallel beta-helix repeat protein